MLYQYGYSKPFAAWRRGRIATVRQVVPALFLLTLAALAVAGPASPVFWLAGLAVRGLIEEEDAAEMAHECAYGLAKRAYRLSQSET